MYHYSLCFCSCGTHQNNLLHNTKTALHGDLLWLTLQTTALIGKKKPDTIKSSLEKHLDMQSDSTESTFVFGGSYINVMAPENMTAQGRKEQNTASDKTE